MNSSELNEPRVNVFSSLEVAQSKTHHISSKDLIAFGEQNSGFLLKFVQKVFGRMKWVNDAINERFYNRAVTVINQHNWEIVKNEFKILGQEKNASLDKLVPKDVLLLPGTAQYKMIKKYHDDEELKSEVKSMKNPIDGNKWFEQKNKEEHWLDSFTYDLEKELDGLLEGDSSSIHKLNEIKSENRLVSQEDFGALAQAVVGNNLKKVTDTQIQIMKDVIKFSNEHELKPLEVYKLLENQLQHYDKTDDEMTFLSFFRNQKLTTPLTAPQAMKEVIINFNLSELDKLKDKFALLGSPENLGKRISNEVSSGGTYYKDHAPLKINPENLKVQMDRLENFKDLVEPYGLADDFTRHIKNEFNSNAQQSTPLVEAFEKVATKMETFLTSFQGVEGMEPKDLNTLYELYTDRIIKSEKSPTEVAREINVKLKEEGLKATLDSLNLKKQLTDVGVLNAIDVAGDRISDAFSEWVNSMKTPPTDSEKQIMAKKEAFKGWLNQKIPKEDATRLYEFYDRVVDKQVYSPDVLRQVLQDKIEHSSNLESFMDSLFPRTSISWFGSKKYIEADPLDLFFESAGKEDLLASSFNFQAREMVKQMSSAMQVSYDPDLFADQISSLFKNRNALMDKESLDAAMGFIAFAASLGVQGYPIPIIMKELDAKRANFADFDLKEMGGELDRVALKRIEDNIRKDTIRATIQKSQKSDTAVNVFKRDPTALIATVGSTFIKKLFPDTPSINQKAIEGDLNAFAPLLNPMIAKARIKKEELINMGVEFLINTSPETLSEAPAPLKKIAKDQLDYTKPGMFQSAVNTILDANEKYRRSLENKKELNRTELSGVEDWLIFELPKLSTGTAWAETLSSFVPGRITTSVAKTAVSSIVSSQLAKMQGITREEKEQMSDSATHLLEMLLPIIPELKKKHDLKVYNVFVQDLNNLVHSNQEISGEAVAEKIKGIVDHFLDNELAQYSEPIYAAVQTIPGALAKG